MYKITSATPDGSHQQDVILKVRRDDLAVREIDAFRALEESHKKGETPHTPKVLDVAGIFIVTDFVGKPLDDSMLQSPAAFFSFLHAAATAVSKFHSCGWVLLDVKESNFTVRLTERGGVPMVDHCWFIDAEIAHKIDEPVKGIPGM